MFTGIVQGLGEITAVRTNGNNFRTHTVRLPQDLTANLHEGASVAHNGCCLTVTAVRGCEADFDLMAETLALTNLGRLQPGDFVNIERAARFGDEIGGHLMSGHISACTEIISVEQTGNNRTLTFRLPENLSPYILPKGFVGLDGCSLTVGSVAADRFTVHLIPETLRRTLFGSHTEGALINLEIDPQTQAVVDTVRRVLSNRHQSA